MADFLLLNPDGTVECHLTPLIDECQLLEGLGPQETARLTTVEWEADRQEWVARWKATGGELASGKVRADVVKAEADYVESLQWR